jgi:hypothetical protein
MNHEILRGVFIARFDQILGAIPFHMYPKGFITEEQGRDAALEAMLLFMFGKEERTASILGFEHLDLIGYALLDYDSSLGNYVVLALFDPSGLRFLWQAYTTIKYFLVDASEAIRKGLSAEYALRKFYGEVETSWTNLQTQKSISMEKDVGTEAQRRLESLAESISLLMETMIAEALAERLVTVNESFWNAIEKAAETFIGFSNAYFGEEFTKTAVLPHLLRVNEEKGRVNEQ